MGASREERRNQAPRLRAVDNQERKGPELLRKNKKLRQRQRLNERLAAARSIAQKFLVNGTLIKCTACRNEFNRCKKCNGSRILKTKGDPLFAPSACCNSPRCHRCAGTGVFRKLVGYEVLEKLCDCPELWERQNCPSCLSVGYRRIDGKKLNRLVSAAVKNLSETAIPSLRKEVQIDSKRWKWEDGQFLDQKTRLVYGQGAIEREDGRFVLGCGPIVISAPDDHIDFGATAEWCRLCSAPVLRSSTGYSYVCQHKKK